MSVLFWGQLVQQLRKEHGISERDMAKRAGMPRSTLRKIEAGVRSTTTIPRVEALLAVFGYELDAFPRKSGGSNAV